MSWISRVAKNIVPKSVSDDVEIALKEWHYTGDTIDLVKPSADCELCDHPDIRYQFVIYNDETDNELLIGSECITKFGISAIDESGRRLNKRETKKKVQQDRNKLITDAKKRSVINSLVSLGMVDEEFDILSFINYVQDRGAFTPSQLSTLIWRLDMHGIEYRKVDFKMTVKRKREKDQLLGMEDWKAKKMWPCMTPAQRQIYIDQNGEP